MADPIQTADAFVARLVPRGMPHGVRVRLVALLASHDAAIRKPLEEEIARLKGEAVAAVEMANMMLSVQREDAMARLRAAEETLANEMQKVDRLQSALIDRQEETDKLIKAAEEERDRAKEETSVAIFGCEQALFQMEQAREQRDAALERERKANEDAIKRTKERNTAEHDLYVAREEIENLERLLDSASPAWRIAKT